MFSLNIALKLDDNFTRLCKFPFVQNYFYQFIEFEQSREKIRAIVRKKEKSAFVTNSSFAKRRDISEGTREIRRYVMKKNVNGAPKDGLRNGILAAILAATIVTPGNTRAAIDGTRYTVGEELKSRRIEFTNEP